MKRDGYFTPNRYNETLVSIIKTYDFDGTFLNYEEKWKRSGECHTDLMWEQQYYKIGNVRNRLINKQ